MIRKRLLQRRCFRPAVDFSQAQPGAAWHVMDAGDFDGNGKADIVWKHDDGAVAIWTIDGLTQTGSAIVGGNPGSSWHVEHAGDYSGDGKADILFRNDSGAASIWTMDGFQVTGAQVLTSSPGTDWHVV